MLNVHMQIEMSIGITYKLNKIQIMIHLWSSTINEQVNDNDKGPCSYYLSWKGLHGELIVLLTYFGGRLTCAMSLQIPISIFFWTRP
jgi:hypothetical protein